MHEKIIQALETAHRTMEHVLMLFRLQVDMLNPDTSVDQYAFLHKAIGYMHTSPGLIHHPAEELIFERLIQYTPQAEVLCNRLSDDHRKFTLQETVIFDHIRDVLQGDRGSWKHIREVGADYCVSHAGHIDDEESQAFPQAVNWLLPEDWRAVDEKCHFASDPLSDPKVLLAYDSLYDYIMAENVNFNRH